MRIIKPGIAKAAKPVTKISEVRKDVQDMRRMLDSGEFDTKKYKPLFVRHRNVSYQPRRVFVLRKELSKITNNQLVFINPHVLEISEEMVEFDYISPVYPEKGSKKKKGPREVLLMYTQLNGSTVKARMKGPVACITELATRYL